MDIQDIIDAIRHNRIRITDHADEEAQAAHLSFDEIFFSLLRGEGDALALYVPVVATA